MSDSEKPAIDLSILPEPPRKRGRRKRIVPESERMKKTSPEWAAHMKAIGRKKGDPKVPGSGRKKTPKEAKELVDSRSEEVVEFLFRVMNDEEAQLKERIKAAQWLGDISLSKAATRQTVDVNHKHSIADMLSEVNALRLSDNSKTIDITPTRIEDAVLVPVPDEDTEND